MNVNFYLTHPGRETSGITMYVSLKGRDYILIQEHVETKFWDKQEQRLTVPRGNDHNERINKRLDDYERMATKHYDRLKDDGKRPRYIDIIDHLNEKIHGKPAESRNMTFFKFVDEFIEQQKKIYNTDGKHGTIVTSYIQTKRLLEDYQTARKVKLSFSNMNLNFYADFIQYMAIERDFTVNTGGGHIKRVRKFLRLSHKAKHHSFDYYEGFKKMESEVDVIALSWNELDQIAAAKLSKDLDMHRDLFLVGCFTGLRHSDFSRLKRQHFIDGFIHIRMQKSVRPVVIPVYSKLIPILEKYDYQLPSGPSQQKINDNLKIIGKAAGVKEKIHWTDYRLSGPVDHISQKYELISTHTARRSFATNWYKAGVPVRILMKITGHKTERDFFRYIRMTPMEEAVIMKGFME